jgi:hypothetical protein
MNAIADTFTLDLSLREMDVVRSALRMLEENHKRNDFKNLTLETQDLRSKVNDVLIMRNLNPDV